jgi:RNA polymerase sigma-70 factor (ECF subfamily)
MEARASEESRRASQVLAETAISDGSLLRRFQQGSGHAATILYFRYAEHLQSLAAARIAPDLACRIDPEDIVQSVFRTFFRRAALGQFEVPDGEDLWKLFLVLALNKLRNAGTYHRAARRDVRRSATADPEGTEGHNGRDENALLVLRLVIEEVLGHLPESARLVVELRIEGHEVAEIAQRSGRSKRSVERILRDFRERLQASLHPGESAS